MASAINYRHGLVATLVIASTSLLIWFGNGLDPWWPLMWFAPLPVLIFALHSSWRRAAVAAGLSMFAGSINMWHYFHVLHAPPIVWFGIYTIVSLVFAASVLLFRALVLRGAPWSALLAFPAMQVSSEFLRNFTTPHGTAGSLAYSQLKFLPFLQLASITGPWGMSFLLLLFPATIAVSLYLRHTAPKQALAIVTSGLGVILAVLIFGTLRLALLTELQHVRVGLIASDAPGNVTIVDEGTQTERLLHDYAREAEKLADRGAQVIVLPEKLGVVVDHDSEAADTIFQSIANKNHSTIVVGLLSVSSAVKYNQARVYSPGTLLLTYDKHHMLPPFESNLKPGTTLTILSKPPQSWGVAICKDMDFTPLSRHYGEEGMGLMLVPAWDFNLDRSWHGHMAVMRGVEDGFTIARAAKQGYLTVSDDRGRILAETRSDSGPFATLLAEVPTTHHATLYLLLGDWFAWLAVAILAFTITRLYGLRRGYK